MTVDQGIGLVGILIGVVLAVAGFFITKVVKDRRKIQRQSVGKGGIAIQSGRDTKIQK